MVTFGIEGISEFDFARSRSIDASNVFFIITICEDLEKGLRKYRHSGFFYPEKPL